MGICRHCGREVVLRGDPSMGGPGWSQWVHVPGGYTPCWPQQGASSTMASPEEG